MKVLALVLISVFASSAWASDLPEVSECSSNSMRELTAQALVEKAQTILERKKIEIADINIESLGQLEFAEDWDHISRDPELVLDDAFNLELITAKGSQLRFYSTIQIYDGEMKYYEPLHRVVSLPEPKVVNHYDNEGNLESRTCLVSFINEKTRYFLLENVVTGHVIYAMDYADYKQTTLVEAELVN